MMTDLLRTTVQEFQQRFQGPPAILSQAPGRINIIGEHTDYAGGLALPAAIDCWTICAWKLRDDQEIHIFSLNLHEAWMTTSKNVSLTMDAPWKKYVGGCISQFLEKNKHSQKFGFNLVIYGNVPLGKGVSSSASLELALLNGLNSLYKETHTAQDLTVLAQNVEHRFLNVKTGLLDQFACQFSKKNSALLVDFLNHETQTAVLHPHFANHSWVLVDSLVPRELAQSKYSERFEESQQVLRLLDQQLGLHIRNLKAEDFDRVFQKTSTTLYKRARHIFTENQRTLKAYEFLKNGSASELGKLLYETHASLSDDYEVSHPDLNFLIETSKVLQGCLGGRMMGGGFGGCALFLVEKNHESQFCQEISDLYENHSQKRTHPRAVEFVDGASAWTYGH